MSKKKQHQHISGLISETLRLLCKSGLTYKTNFSIDALIGITLDEDEVFLVNIKETVDEKGSDNDSHAESLSEESSLEEAVTQDADGSAKKARKRKRKRNSLSRSQDVASPLAKIQKPEDKGAVREVPGTPVSEGTVKETDKPTDRTQETTKTTTDDVDSTTEPSGPTNDTITSESQDKETQRTTGKPLDGSDHGHTLPDNSTQVDKALEAEATCENPENENTANENPENEKTANVNPENENTANKNSENENTANKNSENENTANENPENENTAIANTENENTAIANTENENTVIVNPENENTTNENDNNRNENPENGNPENEIARANDNDNAEIDNTCVNDSEDMIVESACPTDISDKSHVEDSERPMDDGADIVIPIEPEHLPEASGHGDKDGEHEIVIEGREPNHDEQINLDFDMSGLVIASVRSVTNFEDGEPDADMHAERNAKQGGLKNTGSSAAASTRGSSYETTVDLEQLDFAVDAVESEAMTKEEAAQQYGIPLGVLAKAVSVSRSLNYTRDQMRQAVADVLSGKYLAGQAAIKYGIPSSTLRTRIKSKLAAKAKAQSASSEPERAKSKSQQSIFRQIQLKSIKRAKAIKARADPQTYQSTSSSEQTTSKQEESSKSLRTVQNYSAHDLVLAVNDVRERGMALREVANRYNVPMDKLCLAVAALEQHRDKTIDVKTETKPESTRTKMKSKKLKPGDNKESFSEAVMSVKSGALTRVDASKMYGVSYKKLLKATRSFKKKAVYTERSQSASKIPSTAPTVVANREFSTASLKNAIAAVHKGKSVTEASAMYNIPYRSLLRRVKSSKKFKTGQGVSPDRQSNSPGKFVRSANGTFAAPSSKVRAKTKQSEEANTQGTVREPIPDSVMDNIISHATPGNRLKYRRAIDAFWNRGEDLEAVGKKYGINPSRLKITQQRLERRMKRGNWGLNKPSKSSVTPSKLSASKVKAKTSSHQRYKKSVKYALIRATTSTTRKIYPYTEEDFQQAVQDVMENRLSKPEAGKKYNVPYKTIYSYFRRIEAMGIHPPMERKVSDSVESRSSVSTQGSSKMSKSKYLSTDDIPIDELEKAIRSVAEENVPLKRAAKRSGIPVTRLRYHVGVYRDMKRSEQSSQGSSGKATPSTSQEQSVTDVDDTPLHNAVNEVIDNHISPGNAAKVYNVGLKALRLEVMKRRSGLTKLKAHAKAKKTKKSDTPAPAKKGKTITKSSLAALSASRASASSSSTLGTVSVLIGEDADVGGDSLNRMRLNAALREINNGEKTLREASDHFNISMADLLDAVDNFL